MRTQLHHILIPVDSEKAFDLISKPSHISVWWGASSVIVQPETGGLWAAAWGDVDDPDYISYATIASYRPPDLLSLTGYRYYSRQIGDTNETVGESGCVFRVESQNRCALLSIEQSGFLDSPEGDDFYETCRKGWQDVLVALKSYSRTAFVD